MILIREYIIVYLTHVPWCTSLIIQQENMQMMKFHNGTKNVSPTNTDETAGLSIGPYSEYGYTTPEFARWHGMSYIIEEIAEAVDVSKVKNGANGWAILSVVLGIDEVLKRLSDNLNLVVLVCGLLIGTSLSWTSNLPSQFENIDPYDHSHYGNIMIAFIAFGIAAVGCHFFCIIISIQFLQAVNTAARDADKWQMILELGFIPTVIYTTFIIGNFCVAISIGLSMTVIYGDTAGALSATALFSLCGIFLNWFNQKFFLQKSHVVHSWYKRRRHEYDIDFPFASLQKLAEIDMNFRTGRSVKENETGNNIKGN